MPIDLCRLNAVSRAPGGSLGMEIIHQPRPIMVTAPAAITQCSTTAVFVYEPTWPEIGTESQNLHDRHTAYVVAAGGRLEIASVGIADDDRPDIITIGEIVDPDEFPEAQDAACCSTPARTLATV